MRILHVVPTYAPAWRHGGPVLAIHGLARALTAAGHRVTVFTTDVHGAGRLDVPLAEAVDMDGVEVWYFPVRFPRRLYRSPALRNAVVTRVRDFDVVHLHSLFLWPTAVAARAAEAAGVPYLVAPRGMLVRELVRSRGRLRKNLWLRLVERHTLERAAGLHVTTELEAAAAGDFGLRLPPLFCVPNGIDLEELDQLPPATPRDARAEALPHSPFILFLSRLSWKKGPDRLIRALAEVPEQLHLVLAGNDEEKLWPRLARLAADCGVDQRVSWVGPVAGNAKAALLSAATALALPSYSENFANVVLEAMALSCPVIVTPEVGLAPIVEESGAGVVVDGEPELLAAALRRLLAHTEERLAMGRRGRQAAKRFAWPVVARQMIEAYETIIGGSGIGASRGAVAEVAAAR
jgi:glycosyltransferase involved in cell wall biosynthesis